MKLKIETHLSYSATQPCDLLLQIEAAHLPDQFPADESISIAGEPDFERIPGEEILGTRFWLNGLENLECTYTSSVSLNRPVYNLYELKQCGVTSLPPDVLKFLMPSRYCEPDFFNDFLVSEFKDQTGGALVADMANWIEKHFSYQIDASTSRTTAGESFQILEGVCRDYAHVLIAMARAAAIPARMASVYALNVVPQDFHAVVEVYLEDRWILVDPTGMTRADETAIIGVGRDAADVSFLTSYGIVDLRSQTVKVVQI